MLKGRPSVGNINFNQKFSMQKKIVIILIGFVLLVAAVFGIIYYYQTISTVEEDEIATEDPAIDEEVEEETFAHWAERHEISDFHARVLEIGSNELKAVITQEINDITPVVTVKVTQETNIQEARTEEVDGSRKRVHSDASLQDITKGQEIIVYSEDNITEDEVVIARRINVIFGSQEGWANTFHAQVMSKDGSELMVNAYVEDETTGENEDWVSEMMPLTLNITNETEIDGEKEEIKENNWIAVTVARNVLDIDTNKMDALRVEVLDEDYGPYGTGEVQGASDFSCK